MEFERMADKTVSASIAERLFTSKLLSSAAILRSSRPSQEIKAVIVPREAKRMKLIINISLVPIENLTLKRDELTLTGVF